jgi:hypothetical protein
VTLERSAQIDFSGGAVPSTARHLIPENALFSATNGFVSEQDGSIYRRGGAAYLSTADFGSSGLNTLWSGFLAPGSRELFANSSDFGTLDAAEAPVNLGGAGLARPKRAAELAGVVFVGGGAMWAGSRKTGNVTAGTVAVTNGSTAVTGTGTNWDPDADAGMLFRINSLGGRWYPVKSVNSDTSLTLRDPYEGANDTGEAYTLANITTASGIYRSSEIYCVAANRLWAFEENRGYFSAVDNPHSQAADDYHEFVEGAQVIGAEGLGDRALVFTTAGVFMLSNIVYDLTDDFGNSQHRNEKVHPELILLSHEGLCYFSGGLIAACASGVYLVDGISAPLLLSLAIAPKWRDYVEAGYRTGIPTVWRNTLLLPIIEDSGTVVDCLACRLDRPTDIREGRIFPWGSLTGYGGNVSAFAIRSGGTASPRDPKLLAASKADSSRVADCTPFWGPDLENKNDPDGTTPRFEIVTRDYATGPMNENTVRRIRVRYEMRDAASDNPTMQGWFSTGESVTEVSLWDEFVWDEDQWEEADAGEWVQMSGSAPEDEGREPHYWELSGAAGPPHTRYIRFRLRCEQPVSRLIIRSIEMFVRLSGKP